MEMQKKKKLFGNILITGSTYNQKLVQYLEDELLSH